MLPAPPPLSAQLLIGHWQSTHAAVARGWLPRTSISGGQQDGTAHTPRLQQRLQEAVHAVHDGCPSRLRAQEATLLLACCWHAAPERLQPPALKLGRLSWAPQLPGRVPEMPLPVRSSMESARRLLPWPHPGGSVPAPPHGEDELGMAAWLRPHVTACLLRMATERPAATSPRSVAHWGPAKGHTKHRASCPWIGQAEGPATAMRIKDLSNYSKGGVHRHGPMCPSMAAETGVHARPSWQQLDHGHKVILGSGSAAGVCGFPGWMHCSLLSAGLPVNPALSQRYIDFRAGKAPWAPHSGGRVEAR